MVDGGTGGLKRMKESKVYTKKKSFKVSENGMNGQGNMVEQERNLIVGLGSQNNILRSSRFVGASNGFSSLNCVEGGIDIEKGFLNQDNRVTISLAMKTKREVRELKRKLEIELKSIRRLKMKIENGIVGDSGNCGGLRRVLSDVGSVSHELAHESRPSNLLSLSVTVTEKSQSLSKHVEKEKEKEKRLPNAKHFYKNKDFSLAKGKFPPPESNKNLKSSGKKGGASEKGDSFGMGRFLKQAFKNCSVLLERLMKHKHGWVFNSPVDTVALGLRDYYNIIKHPMDLGTVKSRLTNNLYKSPREFAEDVRLTFQNAMTYNPEGQDVHAMAEQLSKIFEEKWGVIETKYLQELKIAVDHGDGLPTLTSRKTARPPPSRPEMTRNVDRSEPMIPPVDPKPKVKNSAQSGRTAEKPKASYPINREMTLEEKKNLSSGLQNLPCEKLEDVVQIIKKRNPSLCQQEDEIEVDIDCLDIGTLRELERFLTNYSKSLSNNKRKAELASQARPEGEPNVSEKSVAPMVVGTPMEKKTDGQFISSTPAQVKGQDDIAG